MFKKMFPGFVAVMAYVILFASQSFADSMTTLSFFDDTVLVDVVFPKVLATNSKKDNSFVIQVKDSSGNPWPEMNSKWTKFSIQMVGMDHGITEVKDVKDLLDANNQFQGRLAVTPKFIMTGSWQLNITLISDTTETKSVQFTVNK